MDHSGAVNGDYSNPDAHLPFMACLSVRHRFWSQSKGIFCAVTVQQHSRSDYFEGTEGWKMWSVIVALQSTPFSPYLHIAPASSQSLIIRLPNRTKAEHSMALALKKTHWPLLGVRHQIMSWIHGLENLVWLLIYGFREGCHISHWIILIWAQVHLETLNLCVTGSRSL